MLTAHKISKAYEKPVLTDFSYHFPKKGIVLIRGASGCGKTTLLRILAGLEQQDCGTIDKDKSLKISCVFQEARLVPHLSLLDNVLLVGDTKNKALAMEYLALLGLDRDAEKRPHQLSGGMKLRASIARSLYYGGNFYLWDEPTKELDSENREIVRKIIRNLSEKACIVTATHDPELIAELEVEL